MVSGALVRRFLGLAFIASLLLLSGCSERSDKKVDVQARLNVVCTFLPIYVIVQNVANGISGVEVRSLLPPQVGCPHNYALTPADAAMLEKADVLVMNGLGMEQFLEGSSYVNRPTLHVIVATRAIEPIELEFPDLSEVHPDHGGDHLLNPHAWVSPFRAAKMATYIGAQLGQIDPEYRTQYETNAKNYADRLDSLGRSMEEALSGIPNRRIVTFHEAFDYLAHDLNLDVIAVVTQNPGVEPSAKELNELILHIKEKKPAAIFAEPQYSDRLARMISGETGVSLYELDPASMGADDSQSYMRTMANNIRVLQQAFGIGD